MSRTHRKRPKPIIGIAGGIGAGKSTVASILQSLGAVVVDSDRLAHEELAAPDVAAQLRRWWGDGVFDKTGGVDRRAVAAIVFSDARERERLEGLLYPRIEARRKALMPVLMADPAVKAVVLDTPKLFEVGLDAECDAVLFVETDRSVRARRVRESRGWTEAEWAQRENLQNPLDSKRANADHLVINHAGVDTLRSQVQRVFETVLASFA